MALEDYRKTQLEKRKELLMKGELPYPATVKRTHMAAEADKEFTALKRQEKEITLAGRLAAIRRHGGATFGNLQDASGEFQFLLRRDNMGKSAYKKIVEDLNVGDFAEITGNVILTKRKERTLDVKKGRLLSKAIRPIPEKWHGLKDVEERYRKRYLDLLMNDEVRNLFLLRSKIFEATREFLMDEAFIDVETPILQHVPGGASAKPFITHSNAFDIDMYLRVAPELYLKRLLIGGMERVFEIGRVFRNEGVDSSHNPDFTMLEFYWAYSDYKDMMKLTERLLTHVVKSIGRGLTREYEGKKIDFKTPWERVEFIDLLKKYAGVDYESVNKAALAKVAKGAGVKIQKHESKAQIADAIYKRVCLKHITNPTFILHQPAELTPLAKVLPERPQYAARFQLVIAGWELANAFSEQNDPVAQREVLEAQESQRKAGDEEAHRLDAEFLEALEYGMPPASGFGMGMDRLTAILADAHSLREIILFPMMKPKE